MSIWELAIKHALRPNSVTQSPGEFIRMCLDAGYLELPMRAEHSEPLDSLSRDKDAPAHKDPLDRMLIAQAKSEGMAFATHDSMLPNYKEDCIRLV